MNKIVYTYYEPIDTLCDQHEIISICKKSWTRYGWDFQIISEYEAKQHKDYEKYKNIILQLPSVNPDRYDYHCFMRWLSMVVVGGGIMIDYDVLNLDLQDTSLLNHQDLTIYQGHVPCVVSGSSDDYLKTVEYFCLLSSDPSVYVTIQEQLHTSDMIMLSSKKIPYKTINIVKDYPANQSKLIHCSATSCSILKKNKLEAMKIILDNR